MQVGGRRRVSASLERAMATAELAFETPTRRGEKFFAWTVFPEGLFGSVGLAILMLNRGVSPLLAFAIPGLLGYRMVIAGERLYPPTCPTGTAVTMMYAPTRRGRWPRRALRRQPSRWRE